MQSVRMFMGCDLECRRPNQTASSMQFEMFVTLSSVIVPE